MHVGGRLWVGSPVLAAVLLLGACSGASGTSGADPRPATHIAPLADTTLTPPGWSPVQVGAVQISVPSTWNVEAPYSVCSQATRGGSVFAFQAPTLNDQADCRLPPNVVAITKAPSGPIPHARRVVHNGIHTEDGYRGRGSGRIRIVRALGMQIRISGPRTNKVLRTMTHSPLSVVVNSTVNSVPRQWRRVTFGGLRFAVPAKWQVLHRSAWGGCPDNIVANVLELNSAKTVLFPICPFPDTDARSLAARTGMVLEAGPKVQRLPAPVDCRKRATLHICIYRQPTVDHWAPGRELSLLTARITAPGWSHPDQIEVGLTGSGLTPLRIFDSIHASG